MGSLRTNGHAANGEGWEQPPFLRRVRVRNFKSIEYCDVELQPLTIILGKNGAGKSNFLAAIEFLRDIFKLGVRGVFEGRFHTWESIFPRHLPIADSAPIMIEIEADIPSNEEGDVLDSGRVSTELHQLSGRFGLWFRIQDEIPIIEREHFTVVSNEHPLAEYQVRNGMLDEQNFSFPSQAWLPEKSVLDALRRPDFPLLGLLKAPICRRFASRLQAMTFYNFMPAAIRSLYAPTHGLLLDKSGVNAASVLREMQRNAPERFDRLLECLRLVVPEIGEIASIEVGGYETTRFAMKDGKHADSASFDAASMSDGTLRALGCLAAVLQQPRPGFEPSLVAIEEPETSLHPEGVRALFDALDEATQHTQVLLTAHNADLLSSRDISSSQVLMVARRGGKSLIAPLDASTREILSRELYSLSELQRLDQLDLDEADVERQANLASREAI
ncbi:MAG: AAA family ATPase [Gemmataceae bacterium]|nr:AAA family ATPase [Gemmataceae bacterium]